MREVLENIWGFASPFIPYVIMACGLLVFLFRSVAPKWKRKKDQSQASVDVHDDSTVDDTCGCCNNKLIDKETISHPATCGLLDSSHCKSCSKNCTRCEKPSDYAIKLVSSMVEAIGWRFGYSDDCIVNEGTELLVRATGEVYVWRADVALSKLPKIGFLTKTDKEFISGWYEKARKNIFAAKFKPIKLSKEMLESVGEVRSHGCNPLICGRCSLNSDVEPSVRWRSDGKVYCNDCYNKSTGCHPSQIQMMNKLGYWIGGSADMSKADKFIGGMGFEDCSVSIYLIGVSYVTILDTPLRPIFSFFKNPTREDVKFILDQYKAMGHWPKPMPIEPTNSIGHKLDCPCPVCR